MGVFIGSMFGEVKSRMLNNNVYLSPGANKSFEESNCTLVGIPAIPKLNKEINE
jgi:hypothetical protein